MSDVDPIASDAWRGPPLASFASRAVALLIDALVLTLGGGAVFVAAFLIVLATVGGGSVESSGEAALLGIGVVSLVTLVAVVAASLYAPLLMARGGRHNGQTLGKQAASGWYTPATPKSASPTRRCARSS